ncbi:MAG: tRNA (adenosine(37)-N6)-dimethylallyltransferase MiaA [Clostridia bacterium]
MLVIVGGSTASGKTDFAASLAKKLNTDIISADSMQIYQGMDIGTAKASDSEIGVVQHCIDIAKPSTPFTVVDYRDSAEKAIINIENDKKIALVVGGTGFYINSLLFSLEYGAERNKKLESQLKTELELHGALHLHSKLAMLDFEAAQKIHPNNTRRLVRALAVTMCKGSFSSQNTPKTLLRPYKIYVLNAPSRAALYARINERVDKMISLGLESEVERLLKSGIDFSMQSMQGIGYKEWAGYFQGNLSIPEVADLIKKNTRAYAKRQETWFNNQYELTNKITIANSSDIDKHTDIIAKLLLNTL